MNCAYSALSDVFPLDNEKKMSGKVHIFLCILSQEKGLNQIMYLSWHLKTVFKTSYTKRQLTNCPKH